MRRKLAQKQAFWLPSPHPIQPEWHGISGGKPNKRNFFFLSFISLDLFPGLLVCFCALPCVAVCCGWPLMVGAAFPSHPVIGM